MNWPPEHAYFIADIGANHDRELERAIKLIRLCASVGVDAVKFQHFRAPNIVSRRGFNGLRLGHQAAWRKGVYETYEAASLPWEWTPKLAEECARFELDFLSTPYDLEAIEHLRPYVAAFKIGSGDITYLELIRAAAATGKPVILSTGASSFADVVRAMDVLPGPVAILQCTSDYTGLYTNANVRVLDTYHAKWPDAVLGLSDHSPNYTAVLPAVTLGARIIEKHFTDDPHRSGPDHGFAMDPHIWHDCIERTREAEAALGDGAKRIEDNERDSAIVQRRCIRAAGFLHGGTALAPGHLEALRPAPPGSIPPYRINELLGCVLTRDVDEGEAIGWDMIESSSPAAAAASARPASVS